MRYVESISDFFRSSNDVVERYFKSIESDLKDCLVSLSDYATIHYYLRPETQQIRLKISANNLTLTPLPEIREEFKNAISQIESLGISLNSGEYDGGLFLVDIGKRKGNPNPRKSEPNWKELF